MAKSPFAKNAHANFNEQSLLDLIILSARTGDSGSPITQTVFQTIFSGILLRVFFQLPINLVEYQLITIILCMSYKKGLDSQETVVWT